MKTYKYKTKNTKELTHEELSNVVELVESRFDQWIFPAIEDLHESKGVSLGFLIMACAIDYMTGLNMGNSKNTTQNDYENFLNKYLWFTAKYKTSDMYKLIRCGLAHNFSLRNSKYALSHKSDLIHLSLVDGRIILKYEDFFRDIKRLKKEYFLSVWANYDNQVNLVERVKTFGFLGPIKINLE